MGMPRFMTAQCWATELLGEASAAGFFNHAAHASMVGKLSQLNSCAGKVMTYLSSQLPYTYVNLVSLVVHVYLFTLATWFGFLFSSGLNMLTMEGELVGVGLGQQTQQGQHRMVAVAGSATGGGNHAAAGGGGGDHEMYGRYPEAMTSGGGTLLPLPGPPDNYDHQYHPDWTAREVGTSLKSDMLTVTFGYCFVGFSNVLFQARGWWGGGGGSKTVRFALYTIFVYTYFVPQHISKFISDFMLCSTALVFSGIAQHARVVR